MSLNLDLLIAVSALNIFDFGSTFYGLSHPQLGLVEGNKSSIWLAKKLDVSMIVPVALLKVGVAIALILLYLLVPSWATIPVFIVFLIGFSIAAINNLYCIVSSTK